MIVRPLHRLILYVGLIALVLSLPGQALSASSAAQRSLSVAAVGEPTAVVATGALNVRSGPGVEYSIATVVTWGQTLSLLGRNASGTWVQVRTGNGTVGWVNAAYISASVPISTLPVTETGSPTPASATGVVITGALNVRSGPSVDYGVVTIVGQGQTVTLVGRNAESTWLQIRTVDGTVGWVNAIHIQANVAIQTLPVVATPTATPAPTSTASPTATPVPTPTALVATGALNVRNGPGVSYGVLTVVTWGRTLELLGRNASGSWAQARTPNGTVGWVNASLVSPSVPVSTLPIVEVAPPAAVAVVTTGALNVRSGPGIEYSVVTVIGQGQSVALVGRNANGSWVQVRLDDGTVGWVNEIHIQANVPIHTLPVAAIPTATAPPPATPTPTTTPSPGPAAVVSTGALNVRSGPGVEYGVVTVVLWRQNLTLLGRNASATWVQVRAPNGAVGWVNASYVITNVAVTSLPVTG